MERLASGISTISIILFLVFGGVALFEHDGTLGIAAAVFMAVGYGAYRVAEGEREDKGAE